ncbi:MAG: hypothetical protein MUE85_00790 [Microscillaceae bacterium]|jgi:hypothetical protein|nr:hypothetical protein [Microscillaceae bacterium]
MSKKYLICILLGILTACEIKNKAEPDDSGLFIKLLGGAGDEIASEAVELPDNEGFAGVGATESANTGATSEIFLFKMNQKGDVVLNKKLGGIKGTSIKVTEDKGFIVLGNKRANDLDYLYLVKTDSKGDTLWTKSIRPTLPASSTLEARHLQVANDGGFLLLGNIIDEENTSAIYLVKTDNQGLITRQKIYGYSGTANDISSLKTLSNEDIVICGTLRPNNLPSNISDIRVTLANSLGNLKWDYAFGQGKNDVGADIQLASGGYIIVGTTFEDQAAQSNILIVKINSFGVEEWKKTFGGENAQVGKSIYATSDGGYIALGTTVNVREGADQTDLLVIKIDAQGNQEWTKSFGSNENDTAGFIMQNSDGNYLIFATTGFVTSTKSAIIRMDKNGNFIK